MKPSYEQQQPEEHSLVNGADESSAPMMAGNLDAILKITVSLKVVLGSASMSVANMMKLGRGAVIPLDRRVDDLVEVTANGRVVARGEVVVLEEDNSRFGIMLTEVAGVDSAAGRRPGATSQD